MIKAPEKDKSSTLARICEQKWHHIAHCKQVVSEVKMHRLAQQALTPKGFLKALEQQLKRGKNALIAEVKKASPSQGVIREDFNHEEIAKAYVRGGATCISVLTDKPYFQGEDRYLQEVSQVVGVPLLRKDFMLDIYQVWEARALGADCILLIMAALTDVAAKQLEQAAHSLGMDVLVEVHDEEELKRALKLSTRLLGINNRNLKTLQVDIATTERLVTHIPKDAGYVVVCESGIKTPADIARMNQVGVYAFLVGESLMRQENVEEAVSTLLGAP